MHSRTRHVAGGFALVVLTSGCFSNPLPATEAGDGTSSSTSTATPTSAPPTSVSATSGVTLATAETSGSSTGAAESDSSSSLVTSSGMGSTGTDASSGSETSGQSTGADACAGTRVEIEGVCLAPLVVTDAYNILGDEGPFDELTPCRELSCDSDLPLGGGFERQNMALHSMQADFDAATWELCGGPDPDQSPNTWNVGARCGVGTGGIFTASEVFSLDADTLWCETVGCPEGTELVGGGGSWGPGFDVTASHPMLDDEEWQVCGGVAGSALEVEVHAYCAVLPVGVSTAVFETIEPIDDVDLVCADALCPVGIAIAGGGDGGVIAARVESSQPAPDGDGWRACGRNELFVGEIRSRVLCYQP